MQDTDKGMVERVADALFDAPDPLSGDMLGTLIWNSEFVSDSDPRGDTMKVCRAAARAAIEAMLVPLRAAVLDNVCEEYRPATDYAVTLAFHSALDAQKAPTEAGAK